MKSFRSPLAKAKGWGTSGDATHFFWVQRLSALALIPLVIWLCISIAFLPQASYPTIVTWFQHPFNSVMMILLVLVAFQHGQMGLQVIIEDYISSHKLRITLILVIKFMAYFLMVLGVFSVIKIATGASL